MQPRQFAILVVGVCAFSEARNAWAVPATRWQVDGSRRDRIGPLRQGLSISGNHRERPASLRRLRKRHGVGPSGRERVCKRRDLTMERVGAGKGPTLRPPRKGNMDDFGLERVLGILAGDEGWVTAAQSGR